MIPEPAARYYVYAVIDKSTSPASVLAVRLSRQDARKAMDNEAMAIAVHGDEPNLRVRRAKLTLFET